MNYSKLTSKEKIANFVDNIKCTNIESIYPHSPRIVVFGDIHGDLEALIYALHSANLLDVTAEAGRWIGGNTTLVITGDLVDDCRPGQGETCYNKFNTSGGADEIIILDFLSNLHHDALKSGGKVLLCMGNHEFMNVSENTFGGIYVQKKTHEFYKGGRDELFRPGGKIAKKLACMMNVICKVGDWIFVHGGLNPKVFKSVQDIETTNLEMKNYLRGNMNPTQEEIFLGKITNEWYFYDRLFSEKPYEPDNGKTCAAFGQIKNIFKNPRIRMVIGHTPHPYPNSVCLSEGRSGNPVPAIYRIDTSMSRAFGAKRNPMDRIYALEIVGDDVKLIHGKKLDKRYQVPHHNQPSGGVEQEQFIETFQSGGRPKPKKKKDLTWNYGLK